MARRRPVNVTAARRRNAAALPDELLVIDLDQARANATGEPVNGRRPQHYGMPKASRDAADAAAILEAEARRRGLL